MPKFKCQIKSKTQILQILDFELGHSFDPALVGDFEIWSFVVL